MSSLEGFHYRVHGKVQGVYFRKYTQQKALELKVIGWIRNDKTNGTVEGQVVCNDADKCQQMKVWLQSQGSPKSQIDHAEIVDMPRDELQIWNGIAEQKNPSAAFEIRKTKKS